MFESTAIENFTEHETIFRERTGNTFSFYYKKFYPKLIYYTSKMCGDTQKAEDVTTESFLTAFEKIDKYEREKSQFSTWLFTIARNIMLQEIKTQKKTISIDVELDEEGSTMKDFLPEHPADDQMGEINIKKAEIMMKYIDQLKGPYKEVIEMREIKKMSYKDIASALNLNLSTLKSRIRNARGILMKMVEKDFSELDERYMD